MTGSKNKDIVEEVFNRSMEVDDRVSALLACAKLPGQVSLEEGQEGALDLKGSLAAKDADSLGCKPFQSAKGAGHEPGPKERIKNIDWIRQVKTVAVAGLVVFVLVFFADSYLRQRGNDSIKTRQEKQYINRGGIVSPLESRPLLDVPPEPVSGQNDKISMPMTLDWQPVVDWSSLLDEISATIPKTVQLNVIESGDGSEMFLRGEALSTDAVYNFVDALSSNRQVKSAELTKTGIGEGQSQDMLTFSICCCLVSDTKIAGSVDDDRNNSALDRSSLFTAMEAEEFFGGIQLVSEHTGCAVKSLLVSPKDAVFEDEETNGRIIRKHAALTILGGYQDILRAIEKLQNRSQGVWFDSVNIKQVSGTGQLECSMGISVYVADARKALF